MDQFDMNILFTKLVKQCGNEVFLFIQGDCIYKCGCVYWLWKTTLETPDRRSQKNPHPFLLLPHAKLVPTILECIAGLALLSVGYKLYTLSRLYVVHKEGPVDLKKQV